MLPQNMVDLVEQHFPHTFQLGSYFNIALKVFEKCIFQKWQNVTLTWTRPYTNCFPGKV